jgi:hypothetical protein
MMAAPLPNPQEYRIQQAIVMQRADADVIKILKRTQVDINRMLRQVAARPSVGANIRRTQLLLVKRELQREMATVWRRIGDTIEARRLEAASRVLDLNKQADTFKLVGAGLPDGPDVARAIADAELDAARSGLDRMIARTAGASYVPLAQRVYASSTALNGPIDRLVSSALSRGLSAREFAKEVAPFINPSTPGGLRYASMRLARTEINNAAHAVAVDSQRDKPWTTGMKWRLSGSHPRVDICNSLASGGPKGDGVYPKGEVPSKPHPQCFCFVTPETVDDETFLNNLVSGQYNTYIDKYRNIQPGQVIRSDAPKPHLKPAKVAERPVKAAPRKKAASAAPLPEKVTAPRRTPAQARAQAYAERFWQSVPPSARAQLQRSFTKLADSAPHSMVKLQTFRIEDAAGTKRLKAATNHPNAIGGYTRATRQIAFADEVIIEPSAQITANRARTTGWWSHAEPGTSLVEVILPHEFGHHLEEMTRRLGILEQERMWNGVLDALDLVPQRLALNVHFDSLDLSRDVFSIIKLANNKKAFIVGVSEYATDSAAELLAEIWAEFTNAVGANLRPHIEKAARVLLEAAERGAQL